MCLARSAVSFDHCVWVKDVLSGLVSFVNADLLASAPLIYFNVMHCLLKKNKDNVTLTRGDMEKRPRPRGKLYRLSNKDWQAYTSTVLASEFGKLSI